MDGPRMAAPCDQKSRGSAKARASIACALIAVGSQLGCQQSERQEPPPLLSMSTSIRTRSTPPAAKDVINAALESAHVSLTTHESCRGVGTDTRDATVGQFLSGFLAELAAETGQNQVLTTVSENADGWLCRLMVRRRDGEQVWSWGLEFVFRKDGTLDPQSYRCVGAG